MRGHVDTAVWNLGLTLVAASGCTRIHALSPAGDDDGTGSSTGMVDTTLSTTMPTGDPITTDASTVVPTTDDPSATDPTLPPCSPDAPCPMGYCCVEYSCNPVPMECPPECPPEQCCQGACTPLDCYDDYECGEGTYCDGMQCAPLDYELPCMSPIQFGLQVPVTVGGEIRALAFIDADGDNQRDVVIGKGDGIQLVRAVDQQLFDLQMGAEVSSLAVGDIDSDMDEDIVFGDVSMGMGGLQALVHGGMLSFVPIGIAPMPNVGGVALADDDGDGIVDVVALDVFEGVQWLQGAGGGMYFAPLQVYDAGTALAVGSLDGDVADDLVVHMMYATTFTGGAAFEPTQLGENGHGAYFRALAVGNFDGAEFDDVIALQAAGGTTILTSWRVGYAAYKSFWYGATTVAGTGDIDDDGKTDVVTAGGEYQFVIAHGASMPTSDVIDCVLTIPTMTAVVQLAVGDFTGDGELDVVTSDGADLAVYVQTG